MAAAAGETLAGEFMRTDAQLAVACVIVFIVGAVVRVVAHVFQRAGQLFAVFALVNRCTVLLHIGDHALVVVAGAFGAAGLQGARLRAVPE